MGKEEGQWTYYADGLKKVYKLIEDLKPSSIQLSLFVPLGYSDSEDYSVYKTLRFFQHINSQDFGYDPTIFLTMNSEEYR